MKFTLFSTTGLAACALGAAMTEPKNHAAVGSLRWKGQCRFYGQETSPRRTELIFSQDDSVKGNFGSWMVTSRENLYDLVCDFGAGELTVTENFGHMALLSVLCSQDGREEETNYKALFLGGMLREWRDISNHRVQPDMKSMSNCWFQWGF
ncbi:hypothetical protein XA68_12428 [Ophiocordyceps unilateralis]|uniref:Cyanovirin-N domain-containing protein n=1 Tax=Ophiocordyceps unilateralis TaxID=268505 RepID=A0A2A9PDK3_OPHUN|nr:hypothetical protein XA68_12428 [Ophiocordyceps unilateralis]